VLFQEWSRRELEGLVALTNGDTGVAEGVFLECVDRANQIAVRELAARSYEDLIRVAERRGDLEAQESWSGKAMAARLAG
jgi:hypothetical protein